jgi:hypothetical protein
VCDTKQCFASLAVVYDITPTGARPKLAEVEAGTPEFDYMLATLVFDLVKKQALAHKVLRKFVLHADPEITRRVLADHDAYEPMGQDYKRLAEATEERMLAAIDEVLEDHVDLARVVVRWADETTDGGAATSGA